MPIDFYADWWDSIHTRSRVIEDHNITLALLEKCRA